MASHEQNISPCWMFNDVCSMVESSITTAGILPMLQAPADDIDNSCGITNTLEHKQSHFSGPTFVQDIKNSYGLTQKSILMLKQ